MSKQYLLSATPDILHVTPLQTSLLATANEIPTGQREVSPRPLAKCSFSSHCPLSQSGCVQGDTPANAGLTQRKLKPRVSSSVPNSCAWPLIWKFVRQTQKWSIPQRAPYTRRPSRTRPRLCSICFNCPTLSPVCSFCGRSINSMTYFEANCKDDATCVL